MEKYSIFCDECGLEIEGGNLGLYPNFSLPADHPLNGPALLSRDYHFHGFNCLAAWASHKASMVPIRRAEPGAGSQERGRPTTDGDHEDAAKGPAISTR